MSSSLADLLFFPYWWLSYNKHFYLLLEVETTRSSAVLSLHLSQCFTPPLKSIPVSFFPHAPCPLSWIPSLPAILTPILRMCHLFKDYRDMRLLVLVCQLTQYGGAIFLGEENP